MLIKRTLVIFYSKIVFISLMSSYYVFLCMNFTKVIYQIKCFFPQLFLVGDGC